MDSRSPGDHSAEESVFVDHLLATFGSVEAATDAKAAADAVLEKYGEWPAIEASEIEVYTYDLWHDAEAAATREAFKHWYRTPDSAYFSVNTYER